MLCQLSYASVRIKRLNVEQHSVDRARLLAHSQAKYSIVSSLFPSGDRWLEREGKTALNGALGLGEVEGAAVTSEEGTITFRQQVPNIYESLGPVG
jgi:hypothetical protein